MEITTLGTSHGDHTYCRFNSSTVFEIRGNLYLFDSGAPVAGLLVRAGKDAAKIKAVFITHMHDDHAGGLPGLIKTLVKYRVPGQLTDIFLPERDAITALNAWLKAQHIEIPTSLINFHPEIPPFVTEIYDDGVLSVSCIPTKHLILPDCPGSFSYLLKSENKKIVYTGDLDPYLSDFPEVLFNANYDLCICEATHYSHNVEKVMRVFRKAKLKRLILNHVCNKWHGEGEKDLKKIFSKLPYPVEIAHDGDIFNL